MTTNLYWLYLEELRKSGTVNMFGAAPYLADKFGISRGEARKVVTEWMDKYDARDYEED